MTNSAWVSTSNEWSTFIFFMLLTLIIVFIAEVMHRKEYLSSYSTRNIVHLIVGVYSSLSPFFFKYNHYPILIAILFLFLNIISHQYISLKSLHSEDRETFGTIYFPLAYLILVAGFWEYPEFLIMSILTLAIADPAASQVGNSVKSPNYFRVWRDEKTIQGTIAFFLCTNFIIIIVGNLLLEFSLILIFVFSLFVSTAATIAESVSYKGTDNLSIPIISILFMIGFFEIFQDPFYINLNTVSYDKVFTVIFIVFSFLIAYYLKALTISGCLGAIVMGILITIFGSFIYLIPISVFFILSSALSGVLKPKFHKSNGTGRDIAQVYANGGIALIICILDFFWNDPTLIYLYLSSVASAASDTWGTEFGKLSKKHPVSILSFQKMNHGTSGGVTLIGTAGSLVGSLVIGLVALLIMPVHSLVFFGIIVSGFLGSIFDSIVGASLQGKFQTPDGKMIEERVQDATLVSGRSWMTNNHVNLLNTAFSPFIMAVFLYLI